MRSDLKAQQEAYAGLRATSGPEVDPPIVGGHHSSLTAGSSSSKVIKEKIDKIHELEDEVMELQARHSKMLQYTHYGLKGFGLKGFFHSVLNFSKNHGSRVLHLNDKTV